MDKYFKNKNTGEIGFLSYYGEVFRIIFKGHSRRPKVYDSLSEFVEAGWEDYEGPAPKEYWYIDWNGEVCRSDIHDGRTERMKLIGNYFETKEEAEKVVEKLKAFKRLKDKGISFKGKVIDKKWYIEVKSDPEQRCFDEACDVWDDIMLIFGGEE